MLGFSTSHRLKSLSLCSLLGLLLRLGTKPRQKQKTFPEDTAPTCACACDTACKGINWHLTSFKRKHASCRFGYFQQKHLLLPGTTTRILAAGWQPWDQPGFQFFGLVRLMFFQQKFCSAWIPTPAGSCAKDA